MESCILGCWVPGFTLLRGVYRVSSVGLQSLLIVLVCIASENPSPEKSRPEEPTEAGEP